MTGTTARVKWNAPSRLIAKITRQSSSETSSTGRITWPATPPAVLTSTSRRPASAAARATKACTAALSRTSTTSARPAPARAPSIAARVASSSAGRTSQAHTVAPSRASATPMARPMPWAAPVTIATRPVSRDTETRGCLDAG